MENIHAAAPVDSRQQEPTRDDASSPPNTSQAGPDGPAPKRPWSNAFRSDGCPVPKRACPGPIVNSEDGPVPAASEDGPVPPAACPRSKKDFRTKPRLPPGQLTAHKHKLLIARVSKDMTAALQGVVDKAYEQERDQSGTYIMRKYDPLAGGGLPPREICEDAAVQEERNRFTTEMKTSLNDRLAASVREFCHEHFEGRPEALGPWYDEWLSAGPVLFRLGQARSRSWRGGAAARAKKKYEELVAGGRYDGMFGQGEEEELE